MDDQLICVLRRPTELAALVSRRRQEFVRPRPGLEGEAESLAAMDPYLEEVRPLEDTYMWGALADVRASWECLGRVSDLSAQTLFHVLNVLVHTLPDGEAGDIPPLKIEPPPAAVQPTAAHPRAYRGTKAKPRKVRRMAPLDLRPHLCVAGDVNRLLVHLAPGM